VINFALNRPVRAVLRQAASLVLGFPGAHAFNAFLSILYIVIQTLIFSRVLDARAFAEIIAATAVALYFLPINQSIARANFVLLRARMVSEELTDGLPEAAASFQVWQAFFVIVILVAPWLIGATTPYEYAWLACFLVSATYSNIWYSEMQMTMLATGRAMQFEVITLFRRVLSFAVLAYLLLDRDILSFNIIAGGQAIVFHIYLIRVVGSDSQLFGWPRGLTWAAMRIHLGRLRTSFQATLAEWLTLNAPYMVFMARFGIGADLVAVDAAMKVVRIIVAVTRNLCEIVLPRVSRAVFNGQGSRARLEVIGVLTLGLSGAAVVSAATYFFQDRTFGFLLGPNNTVPEGAGAPIAVATLSAVTFATAGYLLGHSSCTARIRTFMRVAVLTTTFSSALTVCGAFSVKSALWCFAAALTFISGAGLLLLWGMLSDESNNLLDGPDGLIDLRAHSEHNAENKEKDDIWRD
jgi:hypothetical protein